LSSQFHHQLIDANCSIPSPKDVAGSPISIALGSTKTPPTQLRLSDTGRATTSGLQQACITSLPFASHRIESHRVSAAKLSWK
jgi:hypothetical protein